MAQLSRAPDSMRKSIGRPHGSRQTLLLLTLALALTGMRAHSAVPSGDISLSQMAHRTWGPSEGAPNDVWAMVQTDDGFLLLGGAFGLMQFDGVAFRHYHGMSGDALPDKGISFLYKVTSGGLWIAYRSGGLAFIKDGKASVFSTAQQLPAAPVSGLAESPDGVLWAAHGAGLARRVGDVWEKVGEDWNFKGQVATTVFCDREGILWVASDTSVQFLPKGSHRFEDTSETPAQITGFSQDLQGAVWAADADGTLRTVNYAQRSVKRVELPIASPVAIFDHRGAIWATSTGDGLFRASDPTTIGLLPKAQALSALDKFTSKEGLTADLQRSILEDREHNIWVGTPRGLDRFSWRDVVSVPLPVGYQYFSLTAGEHADVWVGSAERPLIHLDGATSTVVKTVSGAVSVVRQPDGAIWWGGLGELWEYKDAVFTRFPYPPEAKTMPYTMAPAEGGLMVSLEVGTPLLFRQGRWTNYAELVGLPPGRRPLSSYADPAGRVWLGYGKLGIFAVEQGKAKQFPPAGALDIGAIITIAGKDTHVFAGGESGLVAYDGRRFETLRLVGDRPLLSVVGIVESTTGDLWVSDADGILWIKRAELLLALHDDTHRLNYRLFDSLDGLQATPQLAVPFSTLIEATDGRIWFATSAGVAWIDPNHLTMNPIAPTVSILSLDAHGQTYSASTDITLPLGVTETSVRYTAPDLTSPERTQFRYRLQGPGLKDLWQESPSRREAFFTNLAPGSYRFEVNAQNESGVWGKTPAELNFVIPPRFFQTRWFLAACVAVATMLLALIYRIRVRQLSLRLQAEVRSRLSARIEERERIARDLHDTILQGTQGLILVFQGFASRLAPTDGMRGEMESTLNMADRLLSEARASVTDLRNTGLYANLTDALTAAGEQLRATSPMQFRVTTTGVPRALVSTVSDDVYRIGREALSNSFRHSNATSTELSFSFEADAFQMCISDNGRGLDADVIQGGSRGNHFGMQGMRERAQRIGAKLTVSNRIPSGAEVQVIVPAKQAYQDPASGLIV